MATAVVWSDGDEEVGVLWETSLLWGIGRKRENEVKGFPDQKVCKKDLKTAGSVKWNGMEWNRIIE